MNYEEIMMDTPTLLRFNIYRYLKQLDVDSFSINHLAEDMDLNYQQAVIELTEIDEELQSINPDHESILLRAGKVNPHNLSSSIDHYRYHLLLHTVPFQYILYFMNEEEPSIDDFCEKHFISRSTVSRKIGPLKKYLRQFDLRFTYTTADMVGDERMVRLALFCIIWLGTRGIEIPLNIEKYRIDGLMDGFHKYFPLTKTYFGLKEMRLFAAIFLKRLDQEHYAKYDPHYNFLMKDNPYYDFEIIANSSNIFKHALTPKQLKGESSFVYFLAHFAPFYTIRDDESLKQALISFANRPNPVYDLNQEFLIYIKNDVFKDAPEALEDPRILGNLQNITFTYYILQRPFPNIRNLIGKDSDETTVALKRLEESVAKFFDIAVQNPKYSFIKNVRSNFTNAYTNILIPYYDHITYSHKLKVGVAMEHNALFVRKLYRFLDDLRFVESEPYDVTRSSEYDLIISSSSLLHEEQPELPIYFLEHFYTDNDLAELYQFLQKYYVDKNRCIEDGDC